MDALTTWTDAFQALIDKIGPRFVRSEARQWATRYLHGLLSPIPRKNGWQLAETLGAPTPYGIQQFLYRATWDPDALRDDLHAYVVEQLGHPEAVLVVDETGFLKKGRHSVGVQVQYCGTAGRTTNCQVGVFLAYASPYGHTFLDRALYLPQSWATDRERCRAAGVPDDMAFASKPTLARSMLQRAIAMGIPAAWVTADSVYGDGTLLRNWLETVPIGYVLAVSRKEIVIGTDWMPHHLTEYLEHLPMDGWQRLSAGNGAKGPRLFDWLLLDLYDPPVQGWKRWLLFRRSISDPTEVTPYVCFAPATTTIGTLVQVAGQRWRIEQCFEAAKQEVGLDEYEVRSWTGWYRHITLACLAHAFLTVVRSHGADPGGEVRKKGGRRIGMQLGYSRSPPSTCR